MGTAERLKLALVSVVSRWDEIRGEHSVPGLDGLHEFFLSTTFFDRVLRSYATSNRGLEDAVKETCAEFYKSVGRSEDEHVRKGAHMILIAGNILIKELRKLDGRAIDPE